jgi:hypothetical protein
MITDGTQTLVKRRINNISTRHNLFPFLLRKGQTHVDWYYQSKPNSFIAVIVDVN